MQEIVTKKDAIEFIISQVDVVLRISQALEVNNFQKMIADTIGAAKADEFMMVLMKKLVDKVPDIHKGFYELYDSEFTEDEIIALCAVYKIPAGRTVMEKMNSSVSKKAILAGNTLGHALMMDTFKETGLFPEEGLELESEEDRNQP